MDGVDLAYCHFSYDDKRWTFDIQAAETVAYEPEWIDKLNKLYSESALSLAGTHSEYGRFLGKLVNAFVSKHQLKPGFVASHGHTIFHRPDKGFTFQLGDGAALNAVAGLPVIFDFRTQDVALGGQGAPLVPAGDRLLFADYDACLNLGGIANISFEKNNERIAFDVCPANMVLNLLAGKTGKPYDDGGQIASGGKTDAHLLQELASLPYYNTSANAPRSMGRETVEEQFLPLIASSSLSIPDQLCTFCEHIAIKISNALSSLKKGNGKVLITGGGAYNRYLVDRIKAHTQLAVVVPPDNIIQFKEALIFAFLGVLRKRDEVNCLKSVTGASHDHSSGLMVGFAK